MTIWPTIKEQISQYAGILGLMNQTKFGKRVDRVSWSLSGHGVLSLQPSLIDFLGNVAGKEEDEAEDELGIEFDEFLDDDDDD